MARYPQAILVSCEIPWDGNERVLEDVFRREVRHVLRHFNHLYIFGTAGEGYAVDSARFRQIVDLFYEETRGENVHPMVGVIGLSTANIVERIAYAHDVGFRTFELWMQKDQWRAFVGCLVETHRSLDIGVEERESLSLESAIAKVCG